MHWEISMKTAENIYFDEVHGFVEEVVDEFTVHNCSGLLTAEDACDFWNWIETKMTRRAARLSLFIAKPTNVHSLLATMPNAYVIEGDRFGPRVEDREVGVWIELRHG